MIRELTRPPHCTTLPVSINTILCEILIIMKVYVSDAILLFLGNGHVETAEWLLKSDVSGRLIVAKDKNGDTPAHDAAENG